MIKEKCQIHTNMTLDEIHETHDALEENNNDNCGNMCLEGKSKEKVDDLGVKSSIDLKDKNCASHVDHEHMDLKDENKHENEGSRLAHEYSSNDKNGVPPKCTDYVRNHIKLETEISTESAYEYSTEIIKAKIEKNPSSMLEAPILRSDDPKRGGKPGLMWK